MAKMVPSGGGTAATELRNDLRTLEVGLANPRGQGARIIELLRLRDRVGQQLSQLEQQGVDLRPERTRLETVDGGMRRRAALIAKEAQAAGGLAAARAEQAPREDAWWWFLDVTVATRRRKLIRSAVTTLVLVLVLVGGGLWALEAAFGLPPEEKAARNHLLTAENLMQLDQDVDGALAEVRAAVDVAPDYAQGHLYLAALQQLKGDQEAFDESFARAVELMGDPLAAQRELAQAYVVMGQPDQAIAEATKLLEQDPENPYGYYIRASGHEFNAELDEAIADIRRAAELASEQGNDQLYAQAQTRYANLLQRQASQPFPTATAE